GHGQREHALHGEFSSSRVVGIDPALPLMPPRRQGSRKAAVSRRSRCRRGYVTCACGEPSPCFRHPMVGRSGRTAMIAMLHRESGYDALNDTALAALVAARDPGAVRHVTARNNQRLFRAAFAILGNRVEAEDAVQSTYLRAFAAIEKFEGRAALSTWLTRIAINEALGRKRAAERRRASLDGNSVTMLDDYREKLMQGSIQGTSPERMHARAELRRLMESAIAALPE